MVASLESQCCCPICACTHFAYQFSAADRRILNCLGCGLIVLTDRPKSAQLLKLPAKLSERDDSLKTGSSQAAGDAPRLARDLIVGAVGQAQVKTGGRSVLLVGQPLPRLLDDLCGMGLDVVVAGSEMGASDTMSVDLAALRGRRSPTGFNVCLCLATIDRHTEPGEILDALHGLLAPDGMLLFALSSFVWTPSAYEAVSRQPDALQAPYHFVEETIRSLLFRHGFGQVKIGPPPSMVLERRLPTGPALVMAHQRYRHEPSTHRSKVSIIMPVYNEKATFLETFDEISAKELPGLDKEIIVVESNSSDGTRDDVLPLAARDGVVVVLEERPRGKGHAVRTGLARATGDFILIQDADREYDIDDYDVLLEPLVRNRVAFVLGIRHSSGRGYWKIRQFTNQVMMSLVMNFGHLFFTALFNIVYGQRLRDPFTMFKVFRRDCIAGLTFESNRFDFDWELMAKLVRSGFTPLEVPVNYRSRSFAEGKKVSMWRDPITYFRACFKYRFVPL